MTLKVVLDTNFLLIPFQFGVDIFDELDRILPDHKLFIIDRTIDELNNIIVKQKSKHREEAKMALSLIERYNLERIPTPETERFLNVDNLIIKRASEDKLVIATQDAGLKRILKENNVPLVILRKKKFLMLV